MTLAAEDTSWDISEKPSGLTFSNSPMGYLCEWIFYTLAWNLWSKWGLDRAKNSFAKLRANNLINNQKLSKDFDNSLKSIRHWYKNGLVVYHKWYLSGIREDNEIEVTKSDLELTRKILNWKLLMAKDAIKSWTLKQNELALANELLELIPDDLDMVNNIIKKITSLEK